MSCSRFSQYLVAILILATPFAPGQNADVDQAVAFQINTTHNAVHYSPSGPTPPLTIKWQVDLQAEVSYPLVVQGKVFVLLSGGSTRLVALDAETGKILWGPIPILNTTPQRATAAYDNGTIFVVPFTGPDWPNVNQGAMYAFDAADGHQIWSAALPGQGDFSAPVTASKEIVYASGSGTGGTLYAVRESDGELLWSAPVENGDNSAPAVGSSGVFVSYVCPQSYRFSPVTGRLIWHYVGPCEGGGSVTAVLAEERLMVRGVFSGGQGPNGAILRVKDGTVIGSFDSDFPPLVKDKIAFYTHLRQIEAVDLEAGQQVWSAAPPRGEKYAIPPILVNGVLYVATSRGTLLGYRLKDGENIVALDLGNDVHGREFNATYAGMTAAQGLILIPTGRHLVAVGN